MFPLPRVRFIPRHEITADNAVDWALLKQHLDEIGYPVGTSGNGTRVDNDVALTTTITYPSWRS